MFLRISSAALVLAALAACSQEPEEGAPGASGQPAEAANAAASAPLAIPCALAGTRQFKDECQLERSAQDGKPAVILRHPDGGFRRLAELDGGKRFAALDGADVVEIEQSGQELEVTVGDDHYLFPASAKPNAPPR